MKPAILPSRKRPLIPMEQHVYLLTKYLSVVYSNKKEHFWLFQMHVLEVQNFKEPEDQ
jgi:hypothetical protein